MPKAPSLPASQGAPENVIAPSTWTSDWQSAPGLWKRNRHGAPTELDATKQWFANFATRSWRTTASCVSHPVTMGTLCLQMKVSMAKRHICIVHLTKNLQELLIWFWDAGTTYLLRLPPKTPINLCCFTLAEDVNPISGQGCPGQMTGPGPVTDLELI